MDDGGFLITDDTVWDDVLKIVNDDSKKASADDKIIFIEYARNNYLDSMKNFSQDLLDESVILYIHCPFEICWERNVERVNKQHAEGIDAHLVSREEMEKTFLNDDIELLRKESPVPIFTVDNSVTSIELLEKEIDQTVNEMIKKFYALLKGY